MADVPSQDLTPTTPVDAPPVALGDDVLVFLGMNHPNGGLASVERVTPYALNVRYNGVVYSGVRFRGDPILKLRKDLIVDAGGLVWDECLHMRRLREIEDILKKLSVDVAVLKARETHTEKLKRSNESAA
jgi:hypothetical protein